MHRIWTGPLAGAQIVTSWRDYPAAILGYGEKALTQHLLERAKVGETWLDVGAHYGYTSLALCRAVAAGGRVFAFEPSLSTVGCLARTRAVNDLRGWTICPFALNAAPALTPQEMPRSRGMIDSQLTPEQGDGAERFFAVGFDSIWPSICGGREEVDGVKIDVQGMEIMVIEGMLGMLTRRRPMLILEVHAGVSRKRLRELLARAGYRPDASPIEHDAPSFDDEGGNASYVFG